MQVPEKNIKGLSLLELVVVLVLIGVVTAVAYPDFTEWNRERKVRNGTDRVLSFMKNIHAQTERGTFAYVQVLINNNNNRLQLTSKGMTMQDLTDKIHDGEVIGMPKLHQDVNLKLQIIGAVIPLVKMLILKIMYFQLILRM